jgi:hypothetical protein
VWCLREIPEIKVTLDKVISSLKEDREILDDKWSCQIQALSKNVPEQDVDVFPFESSEYSFKQDVSFCFGLQSLFPFLLKNWKRAFKPLGWMKLSELLHHELVVSVGDLHHWSKP